jgi:hypothetical protein
MTEQQYADLHAQLAQCRTHMQGFYMSRAILRLVTVQETLLDALWALERRLAAVEAPQRGAEDPSP